MKSISNLPLWFFVLLILWSCVREKITEPVDDSALPVTPTDLRVNAAQDGAVGIEWRRNTELNLKGYNIYRSVNRADQFKFLDFTPNSYFVDDSLEYDSTYYYRISAVDRQNRQSAPTSYVSATPKNIYAPLKPYLVYINARNWSNSISIKLNWSPSEDTDTKGYEIYRSATPSFEADSAHYLDFTPQIFYYDTKNVSLLTKYYYRIKAVDKGGLKSSTTNEVSDLVLNSPLLVYPSNKSNVRSLSEFRFKAVSRPAKYKLVILSNEVYGTVKEIDFTSDKVDEEIKINVTGIFLEPYKTYTWRVYTYTASEIDPNSYSEYFSFDYFPF